MSLQFQSSSKAPSHRGKICLSDGFYLQSIPSVYPQTFSRTQLPQPSLRRALVRRGRFSYRMATLMPWSANSTSDHSYFV